MPPATLGDVIFVGKMRPCIYSTGLRRVSDHGRSVPGLRVGVCLLLSGTKLPAPWVAIYHIIATFDLSKRVASNAFPSQPEVTDVIR